MNCISVNSNKEEFRHAELVSASHIILGIKQVDDETLKQACLAGRQAQGDVIVMTHKGHSKI